MLQGIVALIVEKVASVLIEKLDQKLTLYFETKAALSEIGKQAGELSQELENAQSEAERKAILRKINDFSGNLGKFR